MRLLAFARLTPAKVGDHLIPLVLHPQLTHLTLIREQPVPLPPEKVTQILYTITKDGAEPRSNSLKTVWGFLQMVGLAWRVLRTEPIEAVYGIYLIPYGLLAWGLGKLFRKKIIISLIGTDLNKDVLEYVYAPVLCWFLRRADIVTVFDEAARQKLLKLKFDPAKVFVLPHGVETEKFQRLPNFPQDIDVIFVGYFYPLKEIPRLLEAWRLVIQKRPNSRLVLLGDGPQRAQLEAQAQELGISDSVLLAGVVNNVPEWLSRAKIFVNLSNQEGVPMAMIEAMLTGLVPVVTDVGGVASVVKEGENGFLVVNPADPEIVAERILRLLNDPQLFATLQQKALAIRPHHTYASVSEWWTPILKELI